MIPFYVSTIGLLAAVLTTACWIPQLWRVIRTRDTRSLSLGTQLTLTLGVALWLAYGILLADFPLIIANSITLTFVGITLILKLRFG